LFRVSYHAAPLLYAIKNFFAIVFYNFLQSIFMDLKFHTYIHHFLILFF